MKSPALIETVNRIARYFDSCKVGCFGNKGYRKTTDLARLSACIDDLMAAGVIGADSSVFLDMGCGDGRVNLLMSYFVKLSIGIEIDSEILSEYDARRAELMAELEEAGGILPPDNIRLFRGSSLEARTFEDICASTGVAFEDVDLFYTYITLHDVFAEAITERGRPGAWYMVYGFNRVLPRYDAFDLVLPDVGGQGIAALFRKKQAGPRV